jgi:hypothetical protein
MASYSSGVATQQPFALRRDDVAEPRPVSREDLNEPVNLAEPWRPPKDDEEDVK